jgi:general secretion pathway protein A
MYEQFFGLRKAPFSLTPDPEFLYLTPQHQEALAGLTYAIMACKGFVVLAGKAGTGKTTMLTQIMQHLPKDRVQSSVIVNPTLTPTEFLEAVLWDFGFTELPASKPQRIGMLQNFLWKGHREGKISVLIIDEAHKLSHEVLEEVRLLGNFESADRKLLQVALVGQSELDDMLESPKLSQFKQRVALRLSIQPLSANDTEPYIRHRWAKAGGGEVRFTAEAMGYVARASNGIPRIINVICDNALMQAFGDESTMVEGRHVVSACRELCFVEPAVSQAFQGGLAPVAAGKAALPLPAGKALEPIAPTGARPAMAAVEPFMANPRIDDYTMKTLERYAKKASRPSLLARAVIKLGLARRVEMA